jgi:hypothetical protein
VSKVQEARRVDAPAAGADRSNRVTLIGLAVTCLVSLLGLAVGLHTSSQQGDIQRTVTEASLAAEAPRTKVTFDSGTVDPGGQSLSLVLTVEGIGRTDGYGCHLVDSETIANNALTLRQSRTQGQLTVVGGNTHDFDLAPGADLQLTVRYPRTVDGLIQIAVAAPCDTLDSTDEGTTLTVLAANGLLVSPVKAAATPVA